MSGVARLRLRRGVSLFDQVHAAFFGAGEQGIYMPSVHESFLRGDLYQDAAGTTPVTAAGQPVGLWLDRSGNDNHASQPTAASRPTLQQDANGIYCLRFDGVDDWMATPSMDFTGTDKMTVLAGTRTDSLVTRSTVVELTESYGAVGAFAMEHRGEPPRFMFAHTGLTSSVTVTTAQGDAKNVISGRGDLGAPSTGIRKNGSPSGEIGTATGGGNYRAGTLYIGSRGGISARFAADLYGIIVCGAEKYLAQIERAEALANKYTRAY